MSKKKTDSEVNYSKRNCKLTVIAIILYAMTVLLSAGILAVSIRSCKTDDSSTYSVFEVEDSIDFESFNFSADDFFMQDFSFQYEIYSVP